MAARLLAALLAVAGAARVHPPEPKWPRDPLPPALVLHVAALLPPWVAYTDSGSVLRLWPGAGPAVALGAPAVKEAFFMPGGESLLTTASGDATVWSLCSRGLVARIHSSIEVEGSLALPDGERVVSLSEGGRALLLWHARSGRVLRRIPAGADVAALSELRVAHPGDRVLARVQLRRRGTGLAVWSVGDGRALGWWRARGEVWSVDVAPCGGKVLVADRIGLGLSLSIFDIRNEMVEVLLPFHLPDSARARISRSGARVAVATDGALFVWGAAADRVMRFFTVSHRVDAFAIDPDGRHIFTFGHSHDGVVDIVWDVDSGARRPLSGRHLPGLNQLWWRTLYDSASVVVTVSAAGDFVATCLLVGYDDEFYDKARDRIEYLTKVHVWHVASGRLLHRFEDEREVVLRREPCSAALSSVSQVLMDSLAW